LDGQISALKADSLTSPLTVTVTVLDKVYKCNPRFKSTFFGVPHVSTFEKVITCKSIAPFCG